MTNLLLAGSTYGQGFTINTPVNLGGNTTINTTNTLNFNSTVTGNNYNLSLFSQVPNNIFPTVTGVNLLSIAAPGNLTIPAGMPGRVTSMSWTSTNNGNININSASLSGNALAMNNNGTLSLVGQVQINNAADVTLSASSILIEGGLTLSGGGNSITLSGPAQLQGTFTVPGSLSITGATTLIGDTILNAATINTTSIDGTYSLTIGRGASFNPSGRLGGNIPLNNLKLWISDSQFDWVTSATKVTTNTLSLIPVTGTAPASDVPFAIQAASGESPVPFNLTFETLTNPSLFSIRQSLKIGDPDHLQSVYLKGFIPFRNIEVYVYGNINYSNELFLLLPNGQLIDFIGKLAQPLTEVAALSLIQGYTDAAYRNPFQRVASQIKATETTPLIWINSSDGKEAMVPLAAEANDPTKTFISGQTEKENTISSIDEDEKRKNYKVSKQSSNE